MFLFCITLRVDYARVISIVFNSNELSTPHDKVASVLPISELEKHVELPLHWAIKNTKIGRNPRNVNLH